MKAEKQHKVLQVGLIQPMRNGAKLSFVDNRFQVASQMKLIKSIQKKENKTGLPDDLKTSIENLSGYSMDDVRVNYNSDKPAQLQALLYTQNGYSCKIRTKKHLPHKVWHVVQQKQGCEQPTMQLQGVNVNNNKGLEREADLMHGKTMQLKAGVESFDVEWNYNTVDPPLPDGEHENFSLTYYAKFKNGGGYNADDAEFRQNAGDSLKIKEGPHKGYAKDTPLTDDGYSRLSDPTDYKGVDFDSDDLPGIDNIDKNDDIDYKFNAEQMIIDTSDSNKEIVKKPLYSVTITGKYPRTYIGLPHQS